jgi:hypothetical protein
MMRTIIKANKQKLSFQVPANYVEKKSRLLYFLLMKQMKCRFQMIKS